MHTNKTQLLHFFFKLTACTEPLLEQTPTSSTEKESSRYAMAIRKRKSAVRRTIGFDQPIIEDTGDDENGNHEQLMKNTNREMYFANNLYKTLCVLCNKNDLRLVPHYQKHHSNHEVLIARLSPAIAESVRKQSQQFELHKHKITGVCVFCEDVKTLAKYGWQQHIVTHTGLSLNHSKL